MNARGRPRRRGATPRRRRGLALTRRRGAAAGGATTRPPLTELDQAEGPGAAARAHLPVSRQRRVSQGRPRGRDRRPSPGPEARAGQRALQARTSSGSKQPPHAETPAPAVSPSLPRRSLADSRSRRGALRRLRRRGVPDGLRRRQRRAARRDARAGDPAPVAAIRSTCCSGSSGRCSRRFRPIAFRSLSSFQRRVRRGGVRCPLPACRESGVGRVRRRPERPGSWPSPELLGGSQRPEGVRAQRALRGARPPFALRWHRGPGTAICVIAAFVCGLGASNHTSMGVVGLAIGVFAVASQPAIVRRLGLLAACVAAGLAGLLPYLYLPLRRGQHPLLDWGHPVDAGRAFAEVVLRRDFWDRAWFEGPADLPPILADYGRSLSRSRPGPEPPGGARGGRGALTEAAVARPAAASRHGGQSRRHGPSRVAQRHLPLAPLLHPLLPGACDAGGHGGGRRCPSAPAAAGPPRVCFLRSRSWSPAGALGSQPLPDRGGLFAHAPRDASAGLADPRLGRQHPLRPDLPEPGRGAPARRQRHPPRRRRRQPSPARIQPRQRPCSF